jgi:WD40 repeat protein
MVSPTIRHICFNNEQDIFAVATDEGVRIFNCHPLIEIANLKSDAVGSVRLVTLLERTNILAIVSGEPKPKFSNNTVMLWDCIKQKFVLEITVDGPVLNVLMSFNKLVIVQRRQLSVFSMRTYEWLRNEESGHNPTGVAALSPDAKMEYLVFPGSKVGSIQLVNLQHASHSRSVAPATIFAHESAVVKVALNNQASKVATGSETGTVIRVFDTRTKKCLMELRRGSDPANLYCMRFSLDSAYLCVSSDKGTIHVFSLEKKEDHPSYKNLLDHVRFSKEEQRSIVKFALPNPEQIAECVFSSSSPTNAKVEVTAVCHDGTYYSFGEWSPKPQGYELIFNLSGDQDFWVS